MCPYLAYFWFRSFTKYAIYLHLYAINNKSSAGSEYTLLAFQGEYFCHETLRGL
jgi:hypothetical protein